MARYYIDPPSGWKYGFPKVYDEDKDGDDIGAWMIRKGYPAELDAPYVRMWPAKEEQEKEADGTEPNSTIHPRK